MNKTKKIITISAYMVNAFLIAILLWVSSYAITASDDYQIINSMKNAPNNILEYLVECVKYSYGSWKGWQGSYFEMFIQAALIKIDFYSNMSHRVLIVFSNIVLFLTIIYFVRTVTSKIKEEFIVALITMAVIMSVIVFNPYTEIYYWYTGMVAYSYPLIAILLGLALIFKMDSNTKIPKIILIIFLGAIGMGGKLVHVAFGCSFMLCILVYRSISNNKVQIRELVCFLGWLFFGMINAVAPGNFERNELATDEGLNISKALINSIYCTDSRIQALLSTGFVVLIIALFICGSLAYDKISVNKIYLAISCCALLIPFIVTFPVMLGYGRQNLPERCAFIVDVSVIMVFFNLAFALGVYIKNNVGFKEINVVALGLLLLVMLTNNYGISNTQFMAMVEGLNNKTYKNYYSECNDFYKLLAEQEKGSDVVITAGDFPDPIENFYNLEVLDYSDYWINVHIANYYGFNSIIVLPE